MSRISDLSQPKISVIVPFYNVADCVSYCLDGLLQQVYDDYEIVCIDDGSTDSTLDLLKEYESRSSKVRVFHKENGGAADARNYGVAYARGEYLSFVDGDDLVSPHYLDVLFRAMGTRDNGMVVGSHRCLSLEALLEGGTTRWEIPVETREVSKRELIKAMAYEEVLPSACMRLARREVYIQNPFPSGNYYEDVATASIFVDSCSSFVMIDAPIYGYIMKPGSVVHRKNVNLKQALDYEKAIASFIGPASKTVGEDDGLRYFRSLELIRLYRLLERVDGTYAEKEALKKKIVRYVRANKGMIVADARVRSMDKLRVVLMSVSPRLLMMLSDVYDGKIKKVQYR